MNQKALLMSPKHPGTRTRHRPLTVRAQKGKDTGLSGIEKAAWRCLEIFLYQRAWQAGTIWGCFPFFLRSKARLPHRFLMGEQLEVPLSLDCLFLPRGPVVAVAVGSGERGGAHLDSVSMGNTSHSARTHTHTHTHCFLPPPPQYLLLPLEWVSSSCWQRWQAQCTEAMGEGGAASVARWYICSGPRPYCLASGVWCNRDL